jgi:F0F1-type ATP synthase epsilon subunit
MMRRMKLVVLTPDSRLAVEDLAAVSAFLTDGGIGILPGHAPLIGETGPQPILCRGEDGREREIAPAPGILSVEAGGITVFAVSRGGAERAFPARLIRNLRPEAETEEGDATEA